MDIETGWPQVQEEESVSSVFKFTRAEGEKAAA